MAGMLHSSAQCIRLVRRRVPLTQQQQAEKPEIDSKIVRVTCNCRISFEVRKSQRGQMQSVWLNRTATNLGTPHCETHFCGSSDHFPASLSLTTLQFKTLKRCQNRTATPLVNVHLSFFLLT